MKENSKTQNEATNTYFLLWSSGNLTSFCIRTLTISPGVPMKPSWGFFHFISNGMKDIRKRWTGEKERERKGENENIDLYNNCSISKFTNLACCSLAQKKETTSMGVPKRERQGERERDKINIRNEQSAVNYLNQCHFLENSVCVYFLLPKCV